MNLSVKSLHVHPLTGGPIANVEEALLMPGAIAEDREYVLYDPNNQRVGSKQARKLFNLLLSRGPWDAWQVTSPETYEIFTLPVEADPVSDVTIDEFGDSTPCYDLGDEAAEFFSTYLQTEVRLGQKTLQWLLGQGKPVAERKVAPIHIMSESTVEWVSSNLPETNPDQRRFRPNIVIAGDIEPEGEQAWVGRTMQIGSVAIHIERPTMRCEVTGFDPVTGENFKDVPKLFQRMRKAMDEKGRPKAVSGVYAYPLTKKPYNIHIGDNIILED